MRKRISDNNIFPEFSLEAEYKKLHELFFDNTAFGRTMYEYLRTSPCLSYNDCLEAMFLDWKLRGTFTSIEEMVFALEISEDDFDKSVTEDRLLDYIQYLLNAVAFVLREVKRGNYPIYKVDDTISNAILDNSLQIIERLGAELKNDDKKGELYIIYRDDIATAVAKQDEELAPSIVEYLKIDNRHDLKRKGEILCTLAKKLEPYEKKLCGTEFRALCTDTTFLLNNAGARHSYNSNDKVNAKFSRMSEADIEKWYDRTFQMFLSCMSVVPYMNYKSEIMEIKRGESNS